MSKASANQDTRAGSPRREDPYDENIHDDDVHMNDELMNNNQATDENAVLSENSSLNPKFVSCVAAAINDEAEKQALKLTSQMHPADMADLLEQLPDHCREKLVSLLGSDFEGETLVELNEDVRDSVIENMSVGQLAETLSELDTDDAACVLEDMGEAERAEVLAAVPVAERLALEAALDYGEDTAGRLMQRDVFAAPSYWTVAQISERLRNAEDVPSRFYEVYVIDPAFKALGTVPLSRFLRAGPETVISDLISDNQRDTRRIPVDMDQEEVAYLFEKYNLISAPVVDAGDRLVGMITVDDVVEIVHEETHEDMLALGGVNAEGDGIASTISKAVRSRFTWLLVNLFTAILASFVISLFGATIEQAVAIAVLMPIVASMGGNAGTQTLTVAVRNLATRDLTTSNAIRIMGRETLIAAINGIAFAILMGAIAGVWYATIGGGETVVEGVKLALVLGSAMLITMICAGFAGIAIPLGLQKLGYDPAVSSAVFVTTVTDVIGFFAFLGLAALFLV